VLALLLPYTGTVALAASDLNSVVMAAEERVCPWAWTGLWVTFHRGALCTGGHGRGSQLDEHGWLAVGL
jgi:hypothetical protein